MSTHHVHGHDIPCHHMKGVSTKQYWYCPHCLVDIILYVEPSEAPTHRCPKQGNRNTPLTKGKP